MQSIKDLNKKRRRHNNPLPTPNECVQIRRKPPPVTFQLPLVSLRPPSGTDRCKSSLFLFFLLGTGLPEAAGDLFSTSNPPQL